MNSIGQNVKVFWTDEDEWFAGVVDQYNVDRGFHIQYFDGDDEWLPSLSQDVKFEDPDFVLEKEVEPSDHDMTSEAKYIPDVDVDHDAEVIDEGSGSVHITSARIDQNSIETPSTASSQESTLEDHSMILKGRVTAARYHPSSYTARLSSHTCGTLSAYVLPEP